MLGDVHREGKGVAQDLGTARQYFEKASAQGNLDARYKLALLLYQGGKGGAKDSARALALFEQVTNL